MILIADSIVRESLRVICALSRAGGDPADVEHDQRDADRVLNNPQMKTDAILLGHVWIVPGGRPGLSEFVRAMPADRERPDQLGT